MWVRYGEYCEACKKSMGFLQRVTTTRQCQQGELAQLRQKQVCIDLNGIQTEMA